MARFLGVGQRMLLLLAIVTPVVSILNRDARDLRADAETSIPFLNLFPIVPVAERFVCTLQDQQGAKDASIRGQDGLYSIKVGNTVYWTFGDTVWEGLSGKSIPNNIAYATDTDASDCVDLTHKAADKGGMMRAQALLPGILGDQEEPWSWPSGMAALEPGSVHFYWNEPDLLRGNLTVTGVGIAKFPTEETMLDGVRLTGGDYLWDNSRTGGLNISATDTAVAEDSETGNEYLYVFLNSTPGGLSSPFTRILLARVSSSCTETGCEAENIDAYEYRDPTSPTGWTANLEEAQVLWEEEPQHNGLSVAYSEFLGKWMAVYGLWPKMEVKVRVADDLWGPWSEGVLLIDCSRYHATPPRGQYACYSAAQHVEFAANGGRTIYVSFSVNYTDATNDMIYHEELHQVQLGTPVWQWSDASGNALYVTDAAADPPGFTRDGIALYAAEGPVNGFVAVYQWTNQATGEMRYGSDEPKDQGPWQQAAAAFYVPGPGTVGTTSFAHSPVYRWDRAGAPSQHLYSALPVPEASGYVQGPVAFIAFCPDSDGNGDSDCREAFAVVGGYPDTDADGCNDGEELGPDEILGGRRNLLNPWDLYDVNGDRVVNLLSDLIPVASAFGAAGGPRYVEAYDRSAPPSEQEEPDPTKREPWDLGPPDGTINLFDDIFGVANQFGHRCAGPP